MEPLDANPAQALANFFHDIEEFIKNDAQQAPSKKKAQKGHPRLIFWSWMDRTIYMNENQVAYGWKSGSITPQRTNAV